TPVSAMALLEQLQQQQEPGAVSILRQIVAWLRPDNVSDEECGKQVETRIHDLRAALESRPELLTQLSTCRRNCLASANFFPAFASLGILPRRGFRNELTRRLYEKMNPAPKDPNDVACMLALVFTHSDDDEWVAAVSDGAWLVLFLTLWHAPDGDM